MSERLKKLLTEQADCWRMLCQSEPLTKAHADYHALFLAAAVRVAKHCQQYAGEFHSGEVKE